MAAVTGAGSGIGRALALADVNGEALNETALLARPPGSRVSMHTVDVSRGAEVADYAATTVAAHGRVNLLVNDAGVALGGTFEELSQGGLEWIMGIDFWDGVYGCCPFLPQLRVAAPARIANVSSVFGLIGPLQQTGYAASKFAVRGFSEALRHELRGSGVGLSVVHPGGIRTAPHPSRPPRFIDHSAPCGAGARTGRLRARLVTSPHRATARILRGIEGDEGRILIGPDATVIDVLQRLFPARHMAVLERLT